MSKTQDSTVQSLLYRLYKHCQCFEIQQHETKYGQDFLKKIMFNLKTQQVSLCLLVQVNHKVMLADSIAFSSVQLADTLV